MNKTYPMKNKKIHNTNKKKYENKIIQTKQKKNR